jgi:small-conductance mechanosensitive channel
MLTTLLLRAALAACLGLIQTPSTGKTPAGPPPTPPLVKRVAPTDAEQIANLRDGLKQAAGAVAKLQARLDAPDGEYQKAEEEFEALNTRYKAAKAAPDELRKAGKTAEVAAAEKELAGLQDDWNLAKERFDIAIRQQKATVQAIQGLKERLASDQQQLDRLEGKTPPAAAKPVAPPADAAKTPEAARTPKPPADPAPKAAPAAPAAAIPAVTLAGLPALPALPAAPKPADPVAALTEEPPVVDTNAPAVRKARESVAARKAELAEVEGRVAQAEERAAVMGRAVEVAQKMLQIERDAVAQAEKAAAHLEETLDHNPPEDPSERDTVFQKLTETRGRLDEARDRAQRIAVRTAALVDNLTGQQTDIATLTREAEAKRQWVTDAEAELDALLSPTSPRNLVRWATVKGPRVCGILLGMAVLHLCLRLFSRRVVQFATRHSQRGSAEDRENRASTLVGVFRYTAGLMVYGGGLVMLLDEVGLPIVPLMGGAAVIGLAVAFGTQNLIRDYFTGFLMLLEDQYSVNDVVRIGTISGAVEQITLRVTVLRDLEGVRHFIPHGGITSVSNLTHGWSRAVIAVHVAYKENVDEVIAVLMQVGKELRADRELGKHIWDEPEMLGVDDLSDSAVVIKVLLKTRPLKQWPVKREMLRRVKNRFDELGIEIPFPHQTVYHHFPDGPSENLPGNAYARSLA